MQGLVLVSPTTLPPRRGPDRKGIIADVTAELEVFDPGFTCTVEIADNAEVEAMDQSPRLPSSAPCVLPLTA